MHMHVTVITEHEVEDIHPCSPGDGHSAYKHHLHQLCQPIKLFLFLPSYFHEDQVPDGNNHRKKIKLSVDKKKEEAEPGHSTYKHHLQQLCQHI